MKQGGGPVKTFERLSPSVLAEWRRIPTAVISDVVGHAGVLSPAIRPVVPTASFAGQALTIITEPVDNGAPRAALAQAWPGAAILVDAGAHPATAVWGGNLIAIAKSRGAVAVVVDGNVRDVSHLRASGLPVFARGITPAGPRWGGRFSVPIRLGGVEAAPGDLVVGDEDGVIVISAARLPGLLERCREVVVVDKKPRKEQAPKSR